MNPVLSAWYRLLKTWKYKYQLYGRVKQILILWNIPCEYSRA
jgi:hypothetical protein